MVDNGGYQSSGLQDLQQKRTIGQKLEPFFFNPTIKLAALRLALLASAGVFGCGVALLPFDNPYSYVYVSVFAFVLVHHLISAFKVRFFFRLLDLVLLTAEILLLIYLHVYFATPGAVDPPSYIVLYVAVWCLVASLLCLWIFRIAAIVRYRGKNLLKSFNLLEDPQRIKGIPIQNCPAAYSMLIGRSIWRLQFKGESVMVRLLRGSLAGGLIIVLIAFGILSFIINPIRETALIPVKESRGLRVPLSEVKDLEPAMWNFAFTRHINATNSTGLYHPDVFQQAVTVTPFWDGPGSNPPCNRSSKVVEYLAVEGAFQTIFVSCPYRDSTGVDHPTWSDLLPDILVGINYEGLQIPSGVMRSMWKSSVRVYAGFTSNSAYLTERMIPIPLPPNAHYLAEVGYDFRKILKHPVLSAFGMFEGTDVFLSSRIDAVVPDPLAQLDPPAYNMSSNLSTFRFYTTDDFSEFRVIEDSRVTSVLGGFAAVGGLWTFIGGVFTMFFGVSLMRIFFGSKPLSLFGIAQKMERDNIARGFLRDYPHIRQELNVPPSEKGIMSLLQDHLLDVSLFRDIIENPEISRDKLGSTYDVEELGDVSVPLVGPGQGTPSPVHGNTYPAQQ